MKKYIVLSVNNNPEYLFYLPLTVWAWRRFGLEPIVFMRDNVSIELYNLVFQNSNAPYMVLGCNDYGSDTIAQISRLYAACIADGYLMTGDVDMIPLSDYWQPNEEQITVWGHDLTGYQHYPICYIGMPSYRWIKIMNLTSGDYSGLIKRDLDSMPNASCDDPVKRWVVDQDLITNRLNKSTYLVKRIDRMSYTNGYPVGRVDRSAWTLNHEQLIDCHMLRGIWKEPRHMRMTMDLLQKVWPNEDFGWFEDYISKFKQLVNG